MSSIPTNDLERLWREPAHWNRDGSYNCTEDPRLLVPKYNGGGWTLNMAHPRAQFTIWLFLTLVVGIAIGVGAYEYFAHRG